jgi:hypothetical protein
LLSAVDTSVRDDETRTLLRTMDAAAAATVRTNVHVRRHTDTHTERPGQTVALLRHMNMKRCGHADIQSHCGRHQQRRQPFTALTGRLIVVRSMLALEIVRVRSPSRLAQVDSRWALAMRLDPTFFASALPPSPQLSNMPFGVFFLAGRHFEGYHVRFTDIARGGLRVVAPATAEAHVVESRRHFNECFSLAVRHFHESTPTELTWLAHHLI